MCGPRDTVFRAFFNSLNIGQPRSQSSSVISNVTSPVKLVGKIRYCTRFQASSGHSDSTNWPRYEAGGISIVSSGLESGLELGIVFRRRIFYYCLSLVKCSLSNSGNLKTSLNVVANQSVFCLESCRQNMALYEQRTSGVKLLNRDFFVPV